MSADEHRRLPLLKPTPGMSWDDRTEFEALVADTGPLVNPGKGSTAVNRETDMEFIREQYATDDIRAFAEAFSKGEAALAQGIKRDPFGALKEMLRTLTPEDRRRVLNKLREIADRRERRGTSEARRIEWEVPKATRRKSVVPPKKRSKSKKTKRRSEPAQRANEASSNRLRKTASSASPTECAICRAVLSPADVEFSAQHPQVFFKRGYCHEHGSKLLVALGFEPVEDAGL